MKVHPLMCPLTVFLEHKSQTSNCSPPPTPTPHPRCFPPMAGGLRKVLALRIFLPYFPLPLVSPSVRHPLLPTVLPGVLNTPPRPLLTPPSSAHTNTPPTVTQFGGDEARTIVSTTGRRGKMLFLLLAFRRSSHTRLSTHTDWWRRGGREGGGALFSTLFVVGR